jgi:SAM-dependent methyltransferase
MADRREHWQSVYTARGETEVSWYQPHSERSLQLIRTASPDRAASVVDIGGGASTLVDDLLADGFGDVAVLDISEVALARSRARLGQRADEAAWIVADITRWSPPRQWDIWHDRAVFHFLTERQHQDAYIAALTAATAPGATVIMATFALDGPETCSGLPVQRYSAATLAARLAAPFTLIAEDRETHTTPGGSKQRFSYAVFRRARSN